jgi:cyclase
VPIPVIASGGGGRPEHLAAAVSGGPQGGHADAALVASMVHFGDYTIAQIKTVMRAAGIAVRLDGSLTAPVR